jgi:hypothetical protein
LRNLQETSITLTYHQSLTYAPRDGVDDVTPYFLAALPFSTPRARQSFARKLLMSDGPDRGIFQALLEVSEVNFPPSLTPTQSPSTPPPPLESTMEPSFEGGQRVTPLTKAPTAKSDVAVEDDGNSDDVSTQNTSSSPLVAKAAAFWAILLLSSVTAFFIDFDPL